MRIGGKASAHAQRVANLAIMLNGSEADVIDLRMSAPRRAACDRDFEFAWQVIEVGVCLEKIRYLKSQRRGVNQLIVGYSGERAPGYVSYYVAACPFGRESRSVERIHHLGHRLGRKPG